ncbi:MAG: HlyC/CorC family transporter [Rhizobiales bacterium]|nr:HlyC/CorC family transporter [Hyphomicrobiales bacterium]
MAENIETPLSDRVEEFQQARVEDIKVPRTDIVSVQLQATIADVLASFRAAGHSRLPVYGETLDDLKGMVHIRDLIGCILPDEPTDRTGDAEINDSASLRPTLDLTVSLEDSGSIRPILFVPPSMPVPRLLARMKDSRTHMAIVVDEYGGTDGLVSLEDLLEVVVGAIEDEHDQDSTPEIRRIDDATFLVDARARIDDVFEAIGGEMPEGDAFDEVETIGGYVMTLAGRLPDKGEILADSQERTFEIVGADPQRISMMRIRNPEASS